MIANKFEKVNEEFGTIIGAGYSLQKEFKSFQKWYALCVKKLTKIIEILNSFYVPKNDTNLHPQIISIISQNSVQIGQKLEELKSFIQISLLNSKKYLETDISDPLSDIKNNIQNIVASLSKAEDQFSYEMSISTKGFTSTKVVESGFQKHTEYLRYMNMLKTTEAEIIQLSDQVKSIIKIGAKFESALHKGINARGSANFPDIQFQEHKETISLDETFNVIDQAIERLRALFVGYSEPKFNIPDLFTFNNGNGKMMMAKVDITDEETGEVVFKENDPVKIIDSSYSDFWIVERPNLNKMYVKVEKLKPMIKLQRNEKNQQTP
ncbi:hypothetical protein GPJ56_001449 [Histomonas meleagridis]|uniref:uncharacterized protein n=1 Tax=Histomonas meleagridis TaxID=135588 RepID=UPI0035597F1D|nr:hypothetical protein GPJ56_001449 [Histomonas meleagridis]KAH0798209.1 hypothetical protein GO595_009055 [Histomonas meleagridis]